MQYFYCHQLNNTINNLAPEESKHCIRSLRMSAGDEIYITDGQGRLYRAIITKPDPKRCEYKIEEEITADHKTAPKLHMAVALTKNISRFEWFVEKATEIGIDEITPMITDKSERSVANLDRLTGIMVSAIKQSRRVWLPKLNSPIAFRNIVSQTNNYQCFIAWIGTGSHEHLMNACTKGSHTMVLIGPEGDFIQNEVNLALQHGFSPVSLGHYRLRTETAALTAVQTFNLINQ